MPREMKREEEKIKQLTISLTKDKKEKVVALASSLPLPTTPGQLGGRLAEIGLIIFEQTGSLELPQQHCHSAQ